MAKSREEINQRSKQVIGAAIEVHKTLGPGLLESVYQSCLCQELALVGVPYQAEVILPIQYKGTQINPGFRIDILVDDSIVVELKSAETVLPVHRSQLLTYLKLTNNWLGLLINFNVPLLKQGISRVVSQNIP